MKVTDETLVQRSETIHVPGICASILYNHAYKLEQALEWGEKIYQQRNPNMPYTEVMPFSATVGADPRFKILLCRTNLSDLLAEH